MQFSRQSLTNPIRPIQNTNQCWHGRSKLVLLLVDKLASQPHFSLKETTTSTCSLNPRPSPHGMKKHAQHIIQNGRDRKLYRVLAEASQAEMCSSCCSTGSAREVELRSKVMRGDFRMVISTGIIPTSEILHPFKGPSWCGCAMKFS